MSRIALIHWKEAELPERVARVAGMVKHGGGGGLWICWPKQASGVESDLTQRVVRKAGMDAGLVDYKICAVDETWSGLRFARRDR